MTSELPVWLAHVPLKTVGVLCATSIFGKNIERRRSVLTGTRFFHNTLENMINYALNPILPPLQKPGDGLSEEDSDAAMALRNVRDSFHYIFHIQVEYFKVLQKLRPKDFVSKNSGRELNLNTFAAKGPTLLNSERRYCVLSKIDGVQPFNLNLDWDAEFDWVEDTVCEYFHRRLTLAQNAYAETLHLSEWLSTRAKDLIIPLRTIMNNLSRYYDRLSRAAYFMALNSKRHSDYTILLIRDTLLEACHRLEDFCIDMMRMNILSISKHDLDKLDGPAVEAVVRMRAEDDYYAGHQIFDRRRESYAAVLEGLYKCIGFSPGESPRNSRVDKR